MKLKISLISIFILIPFLLLAQQETLTITTYYPSPYGSYRELRAQRMAIGTTYSDGGAHPWDTDGGCTAGEICNADLVVEGNVGIGITNPLRPLAVQRPSTNYHTAAFVNTNTGSPDDNYGVALGAIGLNNPWGFGGGSIQAARFTEDGRIPTELPGGGYAVRPLALNPMGGNVGIGTTSPARALDVRGVIHIGGSANAVKEIRFAPYGSATEAQAIARHIIQVGSDGFNLVSDVWGAVQNFKLWDGNAVRTRMTINGTTGNVGIGTTSPGVSLDVNGDIRTNAGITLGGVRRTTWPSCRLVWGGTRTYTSSQGIGMLSCPAGTVVVGAGHWNSSSDNEWPWIKCQGLSISCN